MVYSTCLLVSKCDDYSRTVVENISLWCENLVIIFEISRILLGSENELNIMMTELNIRMKIPLFLSVFVILQIFTKNQFFQESDINSESILDTDINSAINFNRKYYIVWILVFLFILKRLSSLNRYHIFK